jgi:hypothetical protein
MTLASCRERQSTISAMMARRVDPRLHLVFVYEAGHAIAAERPEAFTEVVSDFLDRHDAFVVSRTPTVIHP